MINAPDSACQIYNTVYQDTLFRASWYVASATGLFSLLTVYPLCKLIHSQVKLPSTKILAFELVFFSTIYVIVQLLTKGTHTYLAWTYPNSPCGMVLYAKDCMWSYPFAAFSLFGIVFTHCGINIARMLATTLPASYKLERRSMGLLIGFVIIAVSLILALILVSAADPFDKRMNCAVFPTSAMPTANVMFYFLLVIEVITILIYVYSRLRNEKIAEESGRYDLNRRLQIAENVQTIRYFFPTILFHFVTMVIYTIITIILRDLIVSEQVSVLNATRIGYATSAYKLLLMFLQIVPYYILLQNILIYWMLKKEQRNRKQFRRSLGRTEGAAQIYFTKLADQWNTLSR